MAEKASVEVLSLSICPELEEVERDYELDKIVEVIVLPFNFK